MVIFEGLKKPISIYRDRLLKNNLLNCSNGKLKRCKDNIFKVAKIMARISKYKNEMTELSMNVCEEIQREVLKMTIEEIEQRQNKYGISDAQMSDSLSIDRSAMSAFKKNGKIPKYYLVSIFFLFRHLERELK
jgi:hypothetical protein